MADHPNLPAARILLDEARGMIADQKTAVEMMRTRALALLAVGSAIATFFGARLPEHLSTAQERGVLVALTAFGLSAICALWIVAPRKFAFAFGQAGTLAEMNQGNEVEEYGLVVMRVEGLGEDRRTNEAIVRCLGWWLVGVCGLVAVQVIAWGFVATR